MPAVLVINLARKELAVGIFDALCRIRNLSLDKTLCLPGEHIPNKNRIVLHAHVVENFIFTVTDKFAAKLTKLGIFLSCILHCLMNRGAGENVVELVDKQDFPCLFHILSRIISAENVENLGVSHHKLATAVVLLDECLTGECAAVVFVVKLAVVNRELVKIAVNSVEELRNLTVSRLRHARELFKTLASLNLIERASATSVAVAEHTAGNVNDAVLTVIFTKCGDVFGVILTLIRLLAKVSENLVAAV